MVGREMTVLEVMAEVMRDVAFYDESGGGVTFSGGEPLAQPRFLLALLQASKEREIHTVLDTCGQASWGTLDQVRGLVDLFLYDLKLLDDAKHKDYTGVSNRLILTNLERLSALGHDIVLRVPVMPGINTDRESMAQIGAYAAALPALLRVDLLPYHHTAAAKYERLNRVYPLAKMRPPSGEMMAEFERTLSGFGLEVKIGG
jgi:pyruvate formate lyase activating enzyme